MKEERGRKRKMEKKKRKWGGRQEKLEKKRREMEERKNREGEKG